MDRVIEQTRPEANRLAEDHFIAGTIDKLNLDDGKALSEFRQAHEFAPQDARYARALAVELDERKHFADAINVYSELLPGMRLQAQKSAVAKAELLKVLINFGSAYSSNGQAENAAETLEEGLLYIEQINTNGKLDRMLAALLTNLGTSYLGLKRYADAERILLKALPIRQKEFDDGTDYDVGGLVAVLNNLSRAYGHNDPAKEISFAEEANKDLRVSIEKESGKATERDMGDLRSALATHLNTLGLIYFINHRTSDAVKAVAEAVEIDETLHKKYGWATPITADLGEYYIQLATYYKYLDDSETTEKIEQTYRKVFWLSVKWRRSVFR
jgi:tetratricopeptide (TPR) repeat protein